MQIDNIPNKRPTKKQFELLAFIEQFIAEKGYGPSYREIMAGRDYSSVATVAAHVNNLVASGSLIKKGRSARSLELAENLSDPRLNSSEKVNPSDEKWLVKQVEARFANAESSQPSQKQLDELYVLVGTLKILGFSEASNSFKPRLHAIKDRL